MTFLMHAVRSKFIAPPTSAKTNLPQRGEDTPGATVSEAPTSSAQNTPAPSQSAHPEQQEDSPQSNPEEQQKLDSRVPVVSSVLEFAKKSLWGADVSYFIQLLIRMVYLVYRLFCSHNYLKW